MAGSDTSRQDKAQRILLERVALAIWGSFMTVGIALVAAWIGYLPPRVVAIYAALVAVLCAGFYAVIRTGANLRFADPTLTVAQLVAAGCVASYAVYEGGEMRTAFLAMYIAAYAFGAFFLNTRGLVSIAIFYVACYLVVLGVSYLARPAATDLQRELLQVFIFACLLAWMSYVANFVSGLRQKIRRTTADLKSELENSRKAAAALQQSESKYLALFDSSPEAIIITRVGDGRILDANAA